MIWLVIALEVYKQPPKLNIKYALVYQVFFFNFIFLVGWLGFVAIFSLYIENLYHGIASLHFKLEPRFSSLVKEKC